ncbi:MAG: YlxR family protein [Firmicutes bacterium]|nr:YlxR family protein [Candidatus Fermentithermobacillaceae bacterium]
MPRRVPLRTCIGCRTVRPKRELVRVVRTPEGVVELDTTGKRSGRGAYICPDEKCLEEATRGRRWEKALGVSPESAVIEKLRDRIREIQSKGGAL